MDITILIRWLEALIMKIRVVNQILEMIEIRDNTLNNDAIMQKYTYNFQYLIVVRVIAS